MRYGCCLNMVGEKERGIGDEYLEALDAMGYDYGELPLAEMMALSEREFSRLEKRLEKLRIGCEACNNFFPAHMRLTGWEADLERNLAYAEEALARAERLGAKRVVFGSGAAKNVPQGFPLEEGYVQVKELLKALGPMAMEKGIVLCIEPLRKEECNLINTFKEACKLAEEAGSPAVKCLVDYYHMTAEKEPEKHIEIYGKETLKHVHFACFQGRSFPTDLRQDKAGQNKERYVSFAKALHEIGYKERISCEAYSNDFLKDGRAALEFLKRYMDDEIWEEDGYV